MDRTKITASWDSVVAAAKNSGSDGTAMIVRAWGRVFLGGKDSVFLSEQDGSEDGISAAAAALVEEIISSCTVARGASVDSVAADLLRMRMWGDDFSSFTLEMLTKTEDPVQMFRVSISDRNSQLTLCKTYAITSGVCLSVDQCSLSLAKRLLGL